MKTLTNESGAALLQVVFVGILLAITSYLFALFMSKSDRNSMRDIRRNENLNYSTHIGDRVNDHIQLRRTANTVDRIGTGPLIQYP